MPATKSRPSKAVERNAAAPNATTKAVSALQDDECVDWDFCIESPPPRKIGAVNAKLRYVGRRKPND